MLYSVHQEVKAENTLTLGIYVNNNGESVYGIYIV